MSTQYDIRYNTFLKVLLLLLFILNFTYYNI